MAASINEENRNQMWRASGEGRHQYGAATWRSEKRIMTSAKAAGVAQHKAYGMAHAKMQAKA